MKRQFHKYLFIFAILSGHFFAPAQSSSHQFNLRDSVLTQGDVCRLYGLKFDIGTCELSKSSFVLLDSLVFFLKKNSAVAIEIQRFGDDTNPYRSMRLGHCRALNIKKYLELNGIEGMRLIAKSYGLTRPLISDTEIKKAKSREEMEVLKSYNIRTELQITEAP